MTVTQRYAFYWGPFWADMGQGSVLMCPFGGWNKMMKLSHKLKAARDHTYCHEKVYFHYFLSMSLFHEGRLS